MKTIFNMVLFLGVLLVPVIYSADALAQCDEEYTAPLTAINLDIANKQLIFSAGPTPNHINNADTIVPFRSLGYEAVYKLLLFVENSDVAYELSIVRNSSDRHLCLLHLAT